MSRQLGVFQLGARDNVGRFVAAAIALAAIPVPVLAGPGSTQPGATPVPPGSFIILRDVPARNAIVPGAGAADAVSLAPPASVFDSLNGIGGTITDAQAASMTGSAAPGGGNIVVSTLDSIFGTPSAGGAASPEHGAGSSLGGQISGAIQSAVAPLSGIGGMIPGGGH